MRSLIVRIILLMVMTAAISTDAAAQRAQGSLIGMAIDSRGAAVKDARVVILMAGRVAVRETRTNDRGEFRIAGISPGSYLLSVEANGLTQSGGAQPIRIVNGQEFRIVIPLTVSAIEDTLVVSASRTDSPLSETPANTYVVSGAELMHAQRVSVFDALRSSPGVSIAQTARRGGVASMFVRGGESDYTKVLIDGVPANDGGGSFDLADLTTDNISRLELVRGAQSALYGSDAMSGVLQLFTHRGTTSVPEFELIGEGGSFGFNRQMAKLSGLRGGFDYSMSITHLATDGRDRNDDYQNSIASANLGYHFDQRRQIRMTVRNENSGAGIPGATAVLFPDPDDRIERRRLAAGARLDSQTTPFWHQSLSFAYAENNQSSFDPVAQDLSQPGTPPDDGTAFNDFVSFFNNHQRRRGLRYQSDLIAGNGHFISTGLDLEDERAVFDDGLTGDNRVAPDRRNFGFFFQDQISYKTRLFITAGFRVENNSADMPASLAEILSQLGSAPYTGDVGYGTEVMPRISIAFLLRRSGIQSRRGPTRLRLNYGKGIKAPTLIESFSPNQFFLGNPGLKPERSKNFDVGLEQFFLKDRIRLEGTYFDNRYYDQIAFVADPATFGGPITTPGGQLTHFINNDRSLARGIELTLSWHPKQWLQFDGNYTWLDSRLTQAADVVDFTTGTLVPNPEVGMPLLRRPRHSGSFRASWIAKRFDLTMTGIIVGKRRDLDPVTFARFDSGNRAIYNPGYSRIDLAGTFNLTSWINLFARIENILNQDYQEVLGYPAYRLTFSAGLRMTIGGGR